MRGQNGTPRLSKVDDSIACCLLLAPLLTGQAYTKPDKTGYLVQQTWQLLDLLPKTAALTFF